MESNNQLTLEQQFKLTLYKQKIKQLNETKTRKHLLKILSLMMIKDNIIKYFIKNNMP